MGALFEELQVLQTAEKLADSIWHQVSQWNDFARDTLGKQLTRAVDSIGANIAEAFGRYHYGEKLQFLYYARGSVYETKYWLNRVCQRSLLPKSEAQLHIDHITMLARQLNGFLAYIKQEKVATKGPKAQIIRDNSVEYTVNEAALFTQEELDSLQNLESKLPIHQYTNTPITNK